ncbi:MAG: type II toxin-antitoxin system MqsA family antitoxin [Gammaproteobacteria bacterium]|nr:type II toxin-antitoxin system MqsA family antitoxin [Gammaproteobacteria bacterium]NNJ73210.1 type II toxin-antitoxin system MqsA family antitoxin [Enterobacterales bacterium]
MTKRVIGQEILDGIREMKAYERGEVKVRTTELSQPSEPRIIRSNLNLSQSVFAGLLGVSLRTLQEWEQGRRKPRGSAIALLRVAEQHPEIFINLR